MLTCDTLRAIWVPLKNKKNAQIYANVGITYLNNKFMTVITGFAMVRNSVIFAKSLIYLKPDIYSVVDVFIYTPIGTKVGLPSYRRWS